MRPTQRLIASLSRSKHPLGLGIDPEHVPALVNDLRGRLAAKEDVLDFSPASLSRLEDLLVRHYEESIAGGIGFVEEDIAKLIRELAAYVGEVLLRHAGGKWENGGSLQATYLEFPGPVEGVKGEEVRTYPAHSMSIGLIAALSWDAVLRGVSPRLNRVLSLARAKRIREDL